MRKNEEKQSKNITLNIRALEGFAGIFEILGSKTRLKILEMISREEKCVNFLSKELKLSQPTISYHLKLLFDLDLVKQYKSAQWVRYRLNRERLVRLMVDFPKTYGILMGKEEKKRKNEESIVC
ncbi:MAG: metalloregulator ArsR/SmtB family transcription factor [Candidatus Aerophobetes bacterium]|nr:metalloregulator ArsR/SmtB family transcription factor [Candidatus Aerophobetes bacterium]